MYPIRNKAANITTKSWNISVRHVINIENCCRAYHGPPLIVELGNGDRIVVIQNVNEY